MQPDALKLNKGASKLRQTIDALQRAQAQWWLSADQDAARNYVADQLGKANDALLEVFREFFGAHGIALTPADLEAIKKIGQ